MVGERFDRILSVEKKGMLIGITTTPECWGSPMDVSVFMEKGGENE